MAIFKEYEIPKKPGILRKLIQTLESRYFGDYTLRKTERKTAILYRRINKKYCPLCFGEVIGGIIFESNQIRLSLKRRYTPRNVLENL